jgi:hypothetical protein
LLIVVQPPSFKFSLRVCQIEEDFSIQTLVTQSTIEALNETVLHRPARSNEIHFCGGLVRPHFHRSAGEFSAIIRGDRFWFSAQYR